MKLEVIPAIHDVDAQDWNALVPDRHPFLDHAFLHALEAHDCLGERTGWLPRHLLCLDDAGRLIGATPLYVKTNSYGEFVFDWSWADAYRRHGLAYYPKLVSSIPFTPVTGNRLLVAPQADAATVRHALIAGAIKLAERSGCSSVHWLFPTEDESHSLRAAGPAIRLGCQFHWTNAGYADFDAFLAALTTKKRKNIRRERRQVEDAGIRLAIRHGDETLNADWVQFHAFYCDTFERLGGFPTLTQEFFEAVARTMGSRVVLVTAIDGNETVAAALSFRSDTALYGRHWGCRRSYDGLHFEACYYQGIDYCIRHGLRLFEPGAQGEHKIPRGFLPTITRSAHWVVDDGFRPAIEGFLARETPMIEAYAEDCRRHTPFRDGAIS